MTGELAVVVIVGLSSGTVSHPHLAGLGNRFTDSREWLREFNGRIHAIE